MKSKMYRKNSPVMKATFIALVVILIAAAAAQENVQVEKPVQKGPCEAWLKHCDNGECKEAMFENCIQALSKG